MIDDLHRVWGLAIKEFQQLSRDKLLLAFLILAPILELLLMGGLTGGGIENLPLAVVDHDRTRDSRQLIARLERTEELRIKAYSDGVSQARGWMHSGEIAAIAVIPPGYGAALTNPRESAEVQIIADGSSHVVSTVALSTAEDVAARIGEDIAAHQPGASKGPIDLRFVSRFNAGLEDQPGSITAMLGLIVFQVTLIVAAQSFAREREVGTLEQLRVTPLRRLDLMAGKAIPTLLIGLVDFLAMIALVVVWFDIPLRGSLLLLTVLTIPFVLAQIGWGTLISLISRTQQQAMLFVFALALVEVAFSGFLTPAGDMPGVVHALSYVSSVQHYLVIMRSVMLRGAGIDRLWLPAVALSGISAVVLGLSWLRLRAGLDADSLRQRFVGVWRRACRWWCEERPSLCLGRRGASGTKPEWSREPA
ncbi:MAG: ABC transporter permease [Anaerolineae bacterium]|jgi:ABC-2 type transport system permease protein